MSSFPTLALLPLSVTIIGAAFAIVILNHYFSSRRRPHELIWAIAFLLFAIAAACQVFADVSGGWSDAVARTYYLTGAILNVGLLGLGTIYLLFPGKVANVALAVVVILALFSIYDVYTVPANSSILAARQIDWKSYFSVDTTPRWLAAVFSGVGSLVVVAGALWSGIVFWRKRIMMHRMIGVFLLAIGTFTVATGGTIAGLFRNDDYLYPTMALGVIIMFIGYLETVRPAPARTSQSTNPAAERTR